MCICLALSADLHVQKSLMMLKITIQQRRKNASAPWQQRISALVANTVAKQSNGEFEVCRPRTLFLVPVIKSRRTGQVGLHFG